MAVEGDSPIGLRTDLEAAHEENQHINYYLHAAGPFFPFGFRNAFHAMLHLSVLAIRLVRLLFFFPPAIFLFLHTPFMGDFHTVRRGIETCLVFCESIL